MQQFVRIVHEDPAIAPAVVSERAAAAYASRGWQLDELVADPTPVAEQPRELKRPQKNDSTAAWRTYAVALGAERGGISVTEAFDSSREQLVAKYADPPKTSTAPAKAAPKRPRKPAATAQPPSSAAPAVTSTAPATTDNTKES